MCCRGDGFGEGESVESSHGYMPRRRQSPVPSLLDMARSLETPENGELEAAAHINRAFFLDPGDDSTGWAMSLMRQCGDDGPWLSG